jgi:hypothetical protein
LKLNWEVNEGMKVNRECEVNTGIYSGKRKGFKPFERDFNFDRV